MNKIKLPNLLKKLALISFILALPLFLFIKKTEAFETPSLNYPIQFEQALDSDDMNLQSFVNETMKAVATSIFRFITGAFFDIDLDGYALNTKNLNNPGLLSASGMIIAGIYTSPPASGIQYLADMGQKLKIVKPAYADGEGIGFNLMKTTQPIWQTFRNITYVLFVLILVIMGFAIMFRVKISPQAVITFQSALPRIVIALVLITFSYAIVGLIIDIGLYLSNLIAGIFENIFINEMPDKIAKAISDDVGSVIKTLPEPLKTITRPIGSALLYGALIGPIFLMILALTSGIGMILALIISILLLISLFRAIWTLIKAFAMIVINLVFAPFRILVGVLPGSNAIVDWLKDIIANVAIFPTMIAMLFLGNYLILAGIKGVPMAIIENSKLVSSKGIGTAISFGLFNIFTSMLFPLIGIMIIFMIPKISDIIQSFITKKPFAFGTAMGETFAPVTGPARWLGKQAQDLGGTYIKQRVFPERKRRDSDIDEEKLKNYPRAKGRRKSNIGYDSVN